MTQDEYREMLKDPSQTEKVELAVWRVNNELRKSKWAAAKDPDFESNQRTNREKGEDDQHTQMNFILAGMRGYARHSPEEFDAKKSEGGKIWEEPVKRFNKVLGMLDIEVEPSRGQASLQDTADDDSVLGSDAPQTTNVYPDSAQNTDGTNTIRATSCRETNSATAESAVSTTPDFYPKQ
jgi:hypothetical protein